MWTGEVDYRFLINCIWVQLNQDMISLTHKIITTVSQLEHYVCVEKPFCPNQPFLTYTAKVTHKNHVSCGYSGRKNEEITSAFFHCFLGFFGSSKSTRQGRRSHQKTTKELKINTEGNFLLFWHKSFAHLQEVKSPMLNSIRMRLEIIFIFSWMRPVCLV